ncbi:Replication initiation protein [compost metagenome]
MTEPARNRVYQSNQLIESSYTLTLQEKRLILFAASRIDSKNEAPAEGLVTVNADGFASVFGIELRHAYGILFEAVERLWGREIRRYEKGVEVESTRWIYNKKYVEGEGKVELYFAPKLLPHLTLLNREFTGYQLKHISQLNSFYAFRIYELMIQHKRFGGRDFELTKLRELLELQTKYPSVKDFRKYVLEPAVAEINQHTDIFLFMEPLRKGRSIVGFSFIIKTSDQIPLPLDLMEPA